MLLVGQQEGHLVCKKLSGEVLMPLPLTVSCFSKIQIRFTFLVLAHPGSHGQRAIKQMCVFCLDHSVFVLFDFAVCGLVFPLPVAEKNISEITYFVSTGMYNVCLQCFDAVGWAAGRASGL